MIEEQHAPDAQRRSIPPTTVGSPLVKRIAIAALLIPILLLAAYVGLLLALPCVVVSIVLGLREWYRMLEHDAYQPDALIGLIAALGFCAAAVVQITLHVDVSGLVLCGSIMLLLVRGMQGRQQRRLVDQALTLMGACYIGWLMSHHLLLLGLQTPLNPGWLDALQLSAGAAWLYFAFGVNWMHDATAFFVGRRWGRRSIAPRISPQKTWEGFAGGMLGSIGMALLSVPLYGLPVSLPVAAMMGTAGGVAAFFGDLAVSWVKRQFGLKNTGNLLPGHGGLLDRVDSLLFSIPLIYYLVLLEMRIG
ncbi:MAG: phosphatidate cytidylyltransferase [Chloroflexaceae bacterium]|nr:phosphatidate cytidylyltransferase [Chloroflexaceae bacterium]